MDYLLITSQRLHHGEGSRTFSDAEIDHWGEIYLANPWLYRLGISFGEFIESPAAYLHAVGCAALMPLPEGAKFYPLLPAQRAVQERLDAEAAGQQSFPFQARKPA